MIVSISDNHCIEATLEVGGLDDTVKVKIDEHDMYWSGDEAATNQLIAAITSERDKVFGAPASNKSKAVLFDVELGPGFKETDSTTAKKLVPGTTIPDLSEELAELRDVVIKNDQRLTAHIARTMTFPGNIPTPGTRPSEV